MKKLTLIIARSEMDGVMQALVDLACVEILKPDAAAGGPELQEFAVPVEYDLGQLIANKKSIPLLETPHTYIISGWIPPGSVNELASLLQRFIASWEIETPSPDEAELAPVKLFFPAFLSKMRLAGRNRFDPLARKGF